MPDDNQEEQFEFLFQFLSGERKETAPSRLKSRTYTALIRAQQESGPLQALTASEAAGHKLEVGGRNHRQTARQHQCGSAGPFLTAGGEKRRQQTVENGGQNEKRGDELEQPRFDMHCVS